MKSRLIEMTALVLFLLGNAVLATAGEKVTTVRGKVARTKDGVYVGSVVVPEEVWPKGKNLEDLEGRMVEIVGVVRRHDEPSDPSGPIVQERSGPYDAMTRVDKVIVK